MAGFTVILHHVACILCSIIFFAVPSGTHFPIPRYLIISTCIWSKHNFFPDGASRHLDALDSVEMTMTYSVCILVFCLSRYKGRPREKILLFYIISALPWRQVSWTLNQSPWCISGSWTAWQSFPIQLVLHFRQVYCRVLAVVIFCFCSWCISCSMWSSTDALIFQTSIFSLLSGHSLRDIQFWQLWSSPYLFCASGIIW